ncbi:DNA polymerase III subunit tau [Mariniblastus fucicola]|uniref:DNA polymerase III subunit tau n=2 Tax=Mariniblastus fucicola TaxID=980251 RepID=A0A5B9P6P0_9BACT|nr:DNA polymerase III subunit tau [Mariniblastus fucicola]
MAWQQILGHDKNVERFAGSLKRNRMASTFLFVGPAGVGKRTFALQLAQGLLCESNADDSIDPCDQCPSCQQVIASTHPDLIQVSRPPGKAFIPVELFIGDKEHRRQRGLCHDIGLKPFSGKRKVAIIDDADFLNVEGANSLLKTLEEPPSDSILILIGTSEQQQLSTIVSRSQVIRFAPLSEEHVATILGRIQLETEIPIEQLAPASGGSIERAKKLIEPEVLEFRNSFHRKLASLDPAANGYTKDMLGFIDGAGKDASAKRDRAVLAGDFAIEFYSHWLASLTGADANTCDPSVKSAIEMTPDTSDHDTNEIAVRIAQCIETTVMMQRKIRSNVSSANAVEMWLRDLGRACRGQLVDAVDDLVV